MQYFRKVISTLIVVTMLITTSIPVFAQDSQGLSGETLDMTAVYEQIMESEAEWIASLQFADGTIPTYSDPLNNYGHKYKVIPYFTHIALLGLLESSDYAYVVKDYMDWYFEHLNLGEGANTPDGSVYDYIYEQDKVTATPTYDFDSTDSYASTFINLIRKYYEVTGDDEYVIENKENIKLIASAMLSTQQADGLTWAKPAYKVKYLMDNAEVYKGLDDLVWITNQLFEDEEEAIRLAGLKEQVYQSIGEYLWMEEKEMYAPGMFEDGSLINANWTKFYADATAQLFPIWTGILDPTSDRALHLYNSFNEHHSGWTKLNKDDAFPWVMIAYTAAIMGDKVRVDEFLRTIKTTYVDQNHPWPWYVMESGLTMLTAAEIQKQTTETVEFDTSLNVDNIVIDSDRFPISGTAVGLDKIEIEFVNNLTGKINVFEAIPTSGIWQTELSGLINGNYDVVIRPKDRFNNIHHQIETTASVGIDVANSTMAKVTLQSDTEILRRNDSLVVQIRAFDINENLIDLTDAEIEYYTDQENLLVQTDKHTFTLKGIPVDADVNQLTIGAFVTKGNVVLQAENMNILISREAPTAKDAILDGLSRWLVNKQLGTGDFVTNHQGDEINPQLSSIAARGLLNRVETIPLVEKFMTNYKLTWAWPDKYDVYGTKYNEVLADKTWKSTEDYDSTIANLATFITLQRAYSETTGKLMFSSTELDLMTGGVGMVSVQDSDGLMRSKKSGDVKPLTDNLLGLQGMKDSVSLFSDYFEDNGPAAYFNSFADGLKNGIETKLWDSEIGQYNVAINSANEASVVNWADWQEASNQMLAITTGVLNAEDSNAVALYNRLNQEHPNWEHEEALSGQHGLVAYAASLMGDHERAITALNAILEAIEYDELPADWNIASAGYAMLAAVQLEEPVKPELEVNSVTVKVGSTSDVKVVTHHSAGLKSFSFNISYDPLSLKLILVKSNVWDVNYTGQAGNITINAQSADGNVTTEEVIPFIIRFQATGKVGENTFTITNATANKANRAVDLMVGKIGTITVVKDTSDSQPSEDFTNPSVDKENTEGPKSPVNNGGNSETPDSSGFNQIVLNDIENHWAKSIIEKSIKLGFINGYLDGSFRPDGPVTRAEYASMLGRVLKVTAVNDKQEFTDQNQIPAWAQGYIQALVKLGVVQGYKDGSFGSQKKLTKIEGLVIIMRSLNLELDEAYTDTPFTDNDQIPKWAKTHLSMAVKLGIVKGDDKGRFNANDSITRAEAVAMIVALIEYQNQAIAE